jgi:DNA-binding transcriptional LysR family regulator
MNFQQLKFVREAVRNDLNLTEVANVLFTSQSGVSKQIKDLEAELGIEIFVRKGKRLVGLTKAGEGAVQLIERLLLETENLKRFSSEFTDENKGRLVIATTHNQARYALPKVVQRFIERYPDVQLELRQGTPKYVAQTVMRGIADIAIATEALDQFPDLITYPCFYWSHVVIVRPDHPLAHAAGITLADLAQHSIITYNPEFSGRTQIDAAFARAGITPDIRLTAMDADVIKTYVGLGLGVGIVAEMAMAVDPCEPVAVVRGSESLFEPCITKVAVQRGALLRSYAYKFIEMFSPHLGNLDPKEKRRRSQLAPAANAVPTYSARPDLRIVSLESERLRREGGSEQIEAERVIGGAQIGALPWRGDLR